ncbi:DUF1294 domain-containing protein [Polaromonas naphthalenivorans]|uniref:Uncharacterized protein n=1 Tax=Polaromonas naphthalenivorans (strain CJ2) TaxID=365044 RepID=A1VUU5_POLNA|nr:DUF1294 domain-containing protein [Polaromonas naphthalenivorans]ABM39423.1 hypothetical protein Pnap_4136 [Polaromonas naphthalenivorans CJ2]
MIAETKIVGVLSAYLFMGVNGYYFMKIDKKAAREDQLRISEAALIAIGFMCGWLGFFISCCDQHRIWLIYAEARHSEFS